MYLYRWDVFGSLLRFEIKRTWYLVIWYARMNFILGNEDNNTETKRNRSKNCEKLENLLNRIQFLLCAVGKMGDRFFSTWVHSRSTGWGKSEASQNFSKIIIYQIIRNIYFFFAVEMAALTCPFLQF